MIKEKKEALKKNLKQCENMLKELENAFKKSEKLKGSENKLLELKTECNHQIEILNRIGFKIACLGMESAGKSSLLNAWIGENLLPTKPARCTSTIVEIRHTSEKQKYSIEYFSQNEFDQFVTKLKNEVETMNQGNEDDPKLYAYKQEINTIVENYAILQENFDEKVEKEFEKLEDAKKELEDTITNLIIARAIKRVIIWIKAPKLSEIVLIDVPGYNSSLKYHRDQTKRIIREVDAVIIAKDFNKPTLDYGEEEILRFIIDSDKNTKIKNKLILALTKFDLTNDFKGFDDILNDAKSGLEKFTKRVIPTCSYASIVEEAKLNNLIKENPSKHGDGLELLKKTTIECYENSIVEVATNRFKVFHEKINEFYDEFKKLIKSKFDVNVNSQFEETYEGNFDIWWHQVYSFRI
jgi:GTPase SAR1 family protein